MNTYNIQFLISLAVYSPIFLCCTNINRILFIFNARLSIKFSDKLCVNNKNYCEAAWLNCIASSNTFKLDFFSVKVFALILIWSFKLSFFVILQDNLHCDVKNDIQSSDIISIFYWYQTVPQNLPSSASCMFIFNNFLTNLIFTATNKRAELISVCFSSLYKYTNTHIFSQNPHRYMWVWL